MLKFVLALCGVFSLICAVPSAFADQTGQRAAIFEAPSTAAKQLAILEAGAPVKVSGDDVIAEGMTWLIVDVAGKHGYILKSAVKLDSDQVVEAAPVERHEPTIRMRLWLSEGVNFVSSTYAPASNASLGPVNNHYTGNRFALGYDFNFGPDLQWIAGVVYEALSSGESTPDVGDIHRRNAMISLGHFFVPHAFYGKISGGVERVDSANFSLGTSDNFAWTWGATLGVRFPVFERLNAGLEATFERVQSVSTVPFFGTLVSAAEFPSASQFTLNFVLGFDLGRLR